MTETELRRIIYRFLFSNKIRFTRVFSYTIRPFAFGQSRRAVRKYITQRKKREEENTYQTAYLNAASFHSQTAHFRADYYGVWRSKRFAEHITALYKECVRVCCEHKK